MARPLHDLIGIPLQFREGIIVSSRCQLGENVHTTQSQRLSKSDFGGQGGHCAGTEAFLYFQYVCPGLPPKEFRWRPCAHPGQLFANLFRGMAQPQFPPANARFPSAKDFCQFDLGPAPLFPQS